MKNVTFSVAIEFFDMKMHSNSTSKKFQRLRSFGDLGQRFITTRMQINCWGYSHSLTMP